MLLSASSSVNSPWPSTLVLLRVDAALGQRLADRRRLRAARHPDVDRFRIEVLGALHEGREVRIGDRKAHRADDLAAGFLEARWKAPSASWPGPKSETMV